MSSLVVPSLLLSALPRLDKLLFCALTVMVVEVLTLLISSEAQKALGSATAIYAGEGQFMTATKYMSSLAEMFEQNQKWLEACEAWESAASYSESDHAPRLQQFLPSH